MIVSLTQVLAMNEDSTEAKEWLAGHSDDVLESLMQVHHLTIRNADLHGCLSSEAMSDTEKIRIGLKILKDEYDF